MQTSVGQTEKKTVVLGICGSIAAYKAAEVASRLKKNGISVFVIMTEAATRFISPLTFETLTNNPVAVSMWERSGAFDVEHISLAKRADVFAVAPATANFLGKYANGIADDMLTTTVMATKAPVIIAPAMNTNMLHHPATQANIETLKKRGCSFVRPEYGLLAEGIEGEGRLAEPERIVAAIMDALGGAEQSRKDFAGMSVIVTAGPTRESIDPVRFISNRSSGKMGYEIARAAVERGARVILVSGPTTLETPEGCEVVRVETTRQMRDAVVSRFEGCDVVIKAAAPADYMPAAYSTRKIKKQNAGLTIKLERTEDILMELGQLKKTGQILVGFAAETENLDEYALAKMREKNLDMIVANDVLKPGAGFDSETNIVTIFTQDRRVDIGLTSKREIAQRILDNVMRIKREQR